MNSEVPNRESGGDGKESLGGGPWFATFSLLDAGCAVNSSEMARTSRRIDHKALAADNWQAGMNSELVKPDKIAKSEFGLPLAVL